MQCDIPASQMFQPAWGTEYDFSAFPPVPHRSSTSISPKTSIYGPAGGRRGAIVACVEEQESKLEQLRRGSISTIFNTMSFQDKPLQLPVPPMKPSATYMESFLSPPSSPKSPQSPLQRYAELPKQKEEEAYDDRRFQRQIMSRLQALNNLEEEQEARFSDESKLTPPPSPRLFMALELPTRQSEKSGNGCGNKRRARSLKPMNNSLVAPSSPLLSPSSSSTSRSTKGGRRVSAPGTVSSTASAASHKSSRGAVKKVNSSASSSRRGSSKGLEVLLEGTLFKSGWSWASAYENGNTAETDGVAL